MNFCQVFEHKKFDKVIAMIGPNAEQNNIGWLLVSILTKSKNI